MAVNQSTFGGVQTGYPDKQDQTPEYLDKVAKGLINDPNLAGFSPSASTTLARNDQGQLVTNAMRVGRGSAARQQSMTGSVPTPAPAPAPASPPAPTKVGMYGGSDAGAGWGGVQNTPTSPAGKLGDAATMKQHWDQYWSNFGPGTKVPFAGGQLTRNQDGTATFVSADGQSYTYNKDTPFSDLASRFPEIAAVWKNDFGYGLQPTTGSSPGGPSIGRPYFPSNPGAPGNTGSQDTTQTEVTPEMSVEERASRIANTDSPLMQAARGRAMQQMNERGLINSSIGIQAGQDAVLDRATDIAKADAQTEFQNAQANANRIQQMKVAQLQAQTALQQSQISAQTQLSVAEINRQYSQMANLSSAANSQLTSFNNDINNIVLSDLPTEAKEAAINRRTQTYRMSMNVLGSINGDVDMNSLLNSILG